MGGSGYGVIDHEYVEDGRHPDPPRYRIDEPLERNGFGPCDTRIVHPGQRDNLDPALTQLLGQPSSPCGVVQTGHHFQSGSPPEPGGG